MMRINTKVQGMVWFTADEHYFHENIIKYCNRPFHSIHYMNADLVKYHNEVVGEEDIVFHLGDFSFGDKEKTQSIIDLLNGKYHHFVKGSHDNWLNDDIENIFEVNIDGHHIVLCHYAMRVWPRSHYNSWHLFGHSHGRLREIYGKSMDVGVDCNQFRPISFLEVKKCMDLLPDNFNFIKNRKNKGEKHGF